MLKIGNNEKKVMKLLCKKDYISGGINASDIYPVLFSKGILYHAEYTDYWIKIFGDCEWVKKGISYDFEYRHSNIKIFYSEDKKSWCQWDISDISNGGYLKYFYSPDEYRELQLNKILDEKTSV